MINKDEIKRKIDKLNKTGFFSIFMATVFSKVVTLLGGVVLVRVLSKEDYGLYAYIHNCYSMLFLLNDFGMASASLQFMTENFKNEKKQTAILKYSLKLSLISAIAVGILILFSPLFYPYTMEEAKKNTPMLFLVPLITIISGIMSIILRANFENKKYSKLQIFNTAATYIVLISFSLIWGIQGAIFSPYIYGIIILIYSAYLTYKYLIRIRKKEAYILEKSEKKSFLKYAFATQLNNTIGGLMLIIDTFLIGIIIAEPEAIATYNVGSKLPHALTFLSTCIAIYIVPHFIKHNKDTKWIKRNFHSLLKYSIIGFGIICLLLILFSKLIFMILFGEQYYDGIPIYIILMIGLFFTSALKTPCSNILNSLKKIKINIITNIICLIANFISNIYFIKIIGVNGAAITTNINNIVISTVYVIYLNIYLNKMEGKKVDSK